MPTTDPRGCGQPRIPDAGTDPTQCFADTAVGQADGGGPGRAAHAPVSFTVTAVSPYPGSSLETGDLSVTLGGADPRDFVLASNTCGRSMAPGQSCTFTVSFRPTASGVRKATIETTASNGGRTTVTVEAIGLVADGGA